MNADLSRFWLVLLVGHLKWAPVIALGYAASIATHFLVNAGRF